MDKLSSAPKPIRNIIVLTLFLIIAGSFSIADPVPLLKMRVVELQDSLLKDRDGNSYPVKLMLDHNLWMTANLKVNIPGSYCYENIKENCEQYGRLYTWESAQKGCNLLGAGWRLPTNEEWLQLRIEYGGFPGDSIENRKRAYKVLLYGGSSEFNVLFGGGRGTDGKYARLDAHGFYWTATENSDSTAWFYNFGKGGQFVNRHNDGEKVRSFSVRCVRNIEPLKKKQLTNQTLLGV